MPPGREAFRSLQTPALLLFVIRLVGLRTR